MAYFMCGSVNESFAGSAPYGAGKDLEKAKKLLQEAGYKGEKIVVLTPSEPPVQAAAAMVTVQNLKKIGVNVDAQANCDKAPSGWPCDGKLESLRSAWVAEGDATKRKKITDELQVRMYEVVPYVNFGQFYQPMAYRSNLSGVLSVGVPVMWNIEKK